MVDDGRVRQSGVGAADVLGDLRVPHRDTAHMRLIDHRVGPGCLWGTVVVPIEGRRHGNTARDERR